MAKFTRDIFDPKINFSIEEAKGDVNGQSILAKVSGDFFVPEGISRNNRFYSKSLWDKITNLPEVKAKLSDKRMFGTISHEQPINDKALLEGKLSHIVTKLQVKGARGFGEALVLDTPAGRILNTVLRSGAKLFVSSRAGGDFDGETPEGVPIVDENQYVLETFDFVMDPGFLEANPKLVESIDKLYLKQVNNDKEGSNMEKIDTLQPILENITKEKGILAEDLSKALKELEGLKGTNAVLQDENNHVKGELEKFKNQAETIKQYNEGFGSVDELNQAFDVAEKNKKDLEVYESLGTVEFISTELKESKELKEKIAEVGGTFKEIEEAIDSATVRLEEYSILGTPKDIAAAFDIQEKSQEESKVAKEKINIAKLATELGVSEDKVAKVYGKISEEEIKELFSAVKPKEERSLGDLYRKTSINEGNKTPKETNEGISGIFNKSSGERLMTSFG